MPTRRRMAAIVALGISLTILPFLPLSGGSASAATVPYELYCPRTPVGNIVMNDVETNGTMVPADPTRGQRFTISNYQTTIPLPVEIVGAAAALGNSVISGIVTSSVHVARARPMIVKIAHQAYSVPIPSPLPESDLNIGAPAQGIGPFTAKHSGVTVSMGSVTRMTMSISGSNLYLNCKAYSNNSSPTGIVQRGPNGSPIAPVIAESTP
jgi:hypothetical protein